jgi:hypothetical protein
MNTTNIPTKQAKSTSQIPPRIVEIAHSETSGDRSTRGFLPMLPALILHN